MMALEKSTMPPVLLRFRNVVLTTQFLLTIALILSVCFIAIGSPDFWWQLSEGQKILARGDINNILPQAFGLPSSPFVNEYAVYDFLIAAAHEIIGMAGLRVLFGLLNFLPFALVLGIWLRHQTKSSFIYLMIGTVAFGLLGVRLRQRPDSVGSVLSVLLGLTLLRDTPAQLPRARYVIVGIILCVWSNLHSSFIVGLGMLSLSTLETLWRHRLDVDFRIRLYSSFSLLAVGVFGAMLNLNGVSRLWAPFSLQTNFWATAVTSEMWPIELQSYWIMASIIGLGVYFWFSAPGQTRPLWLLTSFLLTALMALVSMRHINLIGCMLILLLAFRLRSDPPYVPQLEVQNPLSLASQTLVSLGMVAMLWSLLLQRVSPQAQGWYAVDALHELHRREAEGAPFLSDMMDGAYAQRDPQNKLRPLIDTGLSRYSNDTVKFFFYLDNQPAALRLALDLLQSDYAIVKMRNAHWAAVLNNMPGWSLSFVSEHSLLFQRGTSRPKSSDALTETLKIVARKTEETYRNAAGIYYTMGLLSPDITLTLLSDTTDSWWKEPNINFMRDWLNGVPPNLLEKAITRLPSETPSQLRLRILIALQLGLIQEAEHLSRSSLLSPYDLEDAVLRAEVLLSTKDPCAARKAVRFIFPPRQWSVRLAEVVNRMKQICPAISNEHFVSPKIQELVWSKETELWTREMVHKLNQRISVDRRPG
jgi:hypothetical protein